MESEAIRLMNDVGIKVTVPDKKGQVKNHEIGGKAGIRPRKKRATAERLNKGTIR